MRMIGREYEDGWGAVRMGRAGVNGYTSFQLERLGARRLGPGVGQSALPVVGLVVWALAPLSMPAGGSCKEEWGTVHR